ncbi:MAG: hypothetical protein OEQ13_08530 [Acidobacteriota bacterium]|nr:hypothetical protein [Acidobacteriota bacterium]
MRRRRLAACLLVGLGLSLAPLPTPAEPYGMSGGRGRPFTIVVRDAPLAEVFEMLSRKEQVNILLGKGVEGSVSVNLFEVSLDEAIRSIADAAGYVAEKRRGTYTIIERGEAGQDSAAGNTIIKTLKVEYSDAESVAEILEKHLSRYGEVTVLPARRLLVVEDLPDFVRRIERLLAEVDRDSRQILIEAKILEITLDDTEKFGIDWMRSFGADDGTATVGVRDLALKTTPGFFFDMMTSDIEIAIDALRDRGRVKTLATPTLLAVEHEKAEVVIGERLGFRVTTTINQITTESVEFLESGVILEFTASVDRAGRIVLEIHPEVSTGTIADGLPSQTTTEVTTKLVADDGQRIFIGGLLKDTESKSRVGIPFLMDIPILGWAFRRNEKILVSTETVVMLTARVVNGETPALAAQKTRLTERNQQYLEEQRQRMERYFGPEPPAPDPDPGEPLAASGEEAEAATAEVPAAPAP